MKKSKLGNLFKNMTTLAQVKNLIETADLSNAKIVVGGEPSVDSTASAKINLQADVKVGNINVQLDLRNVIVEVT